MKKICILFSVFLLIPTLVSAEEDNLSLTVYSSADPAGFNPKQYVAQQRAGYNPHYITNVPGFGVVKEGRKIDLKAGINKIRFEDVAQHVDPTTVSFVDLGDKTTKILEQNFEFDLLNSAKLLDKYTNKKIELVYYRGAEGVEDIIKGTLLSSRDHKLILQTAKGIQILNQSGNIRLGKLPGGLITKPALVWKLRTKNSGKHNVRTTYQTDGITWRADYNLVLSDDEKSADINSWVSLLNLTGKSFKNTQLKLIAGDVQRVQPNQHRNMRYAAKASMEMRDQSVAFKEKSFFEYHLYTLPRKTDVLSNATQQITLFEPASDVGVEKVLVYYGNQGVYYGYGSPATDRHLGNQSNKKVDVYIRFENEKENQLGIPFPAGKVRVYKEDKDDNTLEFVGEDIIDHTPKDETILVRIGSSFDVVGERTQTDFFIDNNRDTIEESFKIIVKNHKDKDQKVIIKENLFRWVNWKLIEKSDKYKKIDSRTIHFPVTVPANGERIVTYRVKYTW